MNPRETAEVLEFLYEASLVNKPRQLTVKVWCRVLGDLRYEDVTAAVEELAIERTSDLRWVTPGDLRARVKAIRAERIRRAGAEDPCPAVDPDRVVSFQAWRIAHRRAIGDGREACEAEQLAAAAAHQAALGHQERRELTGSEEAAR